MLTTEHLAMGGREGEHKSFVLRLKKQISPTPIMAGKVNTNLFIHFETQKQISPTRIMAGKVNKNLFYTF